MGLYCALNIAWLVPGWILKSNRKAACYPLSNPAITFVYLPASWAVPMIMNLQQYDLVVIITTAAFLLLRKHSWCIDLLCSLSNAISTMTLIIRKTKPGQLTLCHNNRRTLIIFIVIIKFFGALLFKPSHTNTICSLIFMTASTDCMPTEFTHLSIDIRDCKLLCYCTAETSCKAFITQSIQYFSTRMLFFSHIHINVLTS